MLEHDEFATLSHLKMTLEGMEAWTAMLAHVLGVGTLADTDYYSDKIVAHDQPGWDNRRTHRREVDRYLTKVFGKEFVVGVGDYDSWVSAPERAIARRMFQLLNYCYALPSVKGPMFDRDEYLVLIRSTYNRLGVATGTIMPSKNRHTSAQAALRWVTTEYGAIFLKSAAAAGYPGDGYVADLSSMENRPVREGYRRIGGRMHLNSSLTRVHKLVLGGVEYRPDDREWDGALYVFRSACLYEGVAGPHTTHSHLLDGALATTAARELPWDHPLRRFVAPFSVGTLAVTMGCTLAITGDAGILARHGGFTPEGVAMAHREWAQQWRMEAYADTLKRHGVAGLGADAYPYGFFAEKLSRVFTEFATEYVAVYWEDDEAVALDRGVQSFFRSYYELFPRQWCPHPPPKKVKNVQTLVAFMSRFLWAVTAQHEQTGNTADYLTSFDAGFVSVRATGTLDDLASLQPSKQNRLGVAYIQCLTAKAAPPLLFPRATDLTRFFLRSVASERCGKNFLAKMHAFREELNAWKMGALTHLPYEMRVRPMGAPCLDPQDIKCAVSV